MCRQQQLYGWMAVAFGVGVLVGNAIDSGFWAFMVGVGAICVGLSRMVKK
jgi:membrane protein implicated in regulation of membrane protease activity